MDQKDKEYLEYLDALRKKIDSLPARTSQVEYDGIDWENGDPEAIYQRECAKIQAEQVRVLAKKKTVLIGW